MTFERYSTKSSTSSSSFFLKHLSNNKASNPNDKSFSILEAIPVELFYEIMKFILNPANVKNQSEIDSRTQLKSLLNVGTTNKTLHQEIKQFISGLIKPTILFKTQALDVQSKFHEHIRITPDLLNAQVNANAEFAVTNYRNARSRQASRRNYLPALNSNNTYYNLVSWSLAAIFVFYILFEFIRIGFFKGHDSKVFFLFKLSDNLYNYLNEKTHSEAASISLSASIELIAVAVATVFLFYGMKGLHELMQWSADALTYLRYRHHENTVFDKALMKEFKESDEFKNLLIRIFSYYDFLNSYDMKDEANVFKSKFKPILFNRFYYQRNFVTNKVEVTKDIENQVESDETMPLLRRNQNAR